MIKKLGIILFTLGLLFFIIFTLSLGGWEERDVKASDELLRVLKVKALTGGEAFADSDSINGAIKYLGIGERKLGKIDVKGIYVDIDGDKVEFIAPYIFNGLKSSIRIKGKVDAKEDSIAFVVSSIRLGKLPIPKRIILNRLKGMDDNININGDRVEINKNILPFEVERFEVKDGKVIFSFKKKVLELFDKKDVVVEEKKDEGSKKSTAVKKVKRLSEEVENSLRSVIQSLNSALKSLKTSDEKEIILTIQSTLNNVIKNPDYPYKKYAESVKARYKKLPDESKERIKSALLNSLDFGDVMKLVSVFGM